MDLAFIGDFSDGEERFPVVVGDAASFGIDAETAVPLEDSYCQRMVEGKLPNIVADARSDERVCDLDARREANIGAYLGVPLRFSNGEVFGTLYCLSHAARTSLGNHDVRFMQVLAGIIIEQLESNEQAAGSRRLQKEADGLHALITALDARDAYSADHSEVVVDLARAWQRSWGSPSAMSNCQPSLLASSRSTSSIHAR